MPTNWTRTPAEPERRETSPAPPTECAKPERRTDAFVPEIPKRRLEDLVVPEAVRRAIGTALNRIRYHRILHEDWNLRVLDPHGSGVAVNLYGPPGTGKSFCAEAIAHHLEKPLLRVNYAELESKFVGETPKNITAAFRKAAETGAVLFFDEADSILGKRLTSVTQSADHGVNVSRSVMLTELERFDGVVLFATNLARNYDAAFVRRILAHIRFDLPDEECRGRLWAGMLPPQLPLDADVERAELVLASDGLAGGDLRNVVLAAASAAVERPAELRRVTRADLLEAIDRTRRAKAEIVCPYPEPTARVEPVRPEDLPLPAKERLAALADDAAA